VDEDMVGWLVEWGLKVKLIHLMTRIELGGVSESAYATVLGDLPVCMVQ
jgi:hypothetical protein